MKSILLIEDNKDIRESTAEILLLEGYLVYPVSCGKDALALQKILIPDFILCDIEMPGMDGYSVYQSFRQNPATNQIPFIFMTAKSEKSDREKATANGVLHYLIKPFDDTELLKCLQSCSEVYLQKD